MPSVAYELSRIGVRMNTHHYSVSVVLHISVTCKVMLSIGMLLGSPFPVQSSPRTIIRHVLHINKDLCKFPFSQGRSLSSYLIHSDRWLTWSGKNIEELGYTYQHRPSSRVDLVLSRSYTVDSLPHSIDRVVPNEDYKYLMANLADAFSDCLYVNFRIPMVVSILK